jgi:hypothetical protein
MFSTNTPPQSKNAWFQAMSSVCTTADAGTTTRSRSTTVDFPAPPRPSIAITRGRPMTPGDAARSRCKTSDSFTTCQPQASTSPGCSRI